MSNKETSKNIELEMISVEEEQKQEDRSITFLSVGWLALYCVVLFCICFLLINLGFQRSVVEGNSMKPTLSEGDNLFVNKITYHLSEPKRFDVIVFLFDRHEKNHYIKRVIGLPGETVQIKDGYVYINDKKLTEDVYGLEVMNSAGVASEPIKLGDDEYFVLGDNRNESSDSRAADVGVVYKKQIIGKATICIFPFDSFGKIDKKVTE